MKVQKKFKVIRSYGEKRCKLCFFVCFHILFLLATELCYGSMTLRLGVVAPPQHPWTKGIVNLKRRVEVSSKGTIEFELVPYSEVTNPRVLLQKIQEGSVELGLLNVFNVGEKVEALRIFSLPFAFRDKVQARIATSGKVAEDELNKLKDSAFYDFINTLDLDDLGKRKS